MASTKVEIPTIDFCNHQDLKPNTQLWESTKIKVFEALKEFGCFVAIYDKVSNDIKEAMFDTLKEVCDLPLSKLKEYREKPYHIHDKQIPSLPIHNSVRSADLLLPNSAETFANTFWPDGKEPNIWFTNYKAIQGDDGKIPGLGPHTDGSYLTIITQDQNVLQLNKNGEWIDFNTTLPNSYVVLSSDSFKVPLMEGSITIGVDCHSQWIEKSNRYVWHWKEGEMLKKTAMTVQSNISYDDFVNLIISYCGLNCQSKELIISYMHSSFENQRVLPFKITDQNENQNIEEEEKQDIFDDRLDNLDMNISDDDQTPTPVDATNTMGSSSQSTQSGNLQDGKTDFLLEFSYWKIYTAMEIAKDLVRGIHKHGYAVLEAYYYMIESTNPISKMTLHVDENGRFKYFFISYSAWIQGFRHLRKGIAVDGTFLRSRYNGVLLVAVA
ncbi:putative 2-oxoglutarate-dependent dioxygenase AOP1.2-like [Capsicum annuum]|nr:putative 2-oxoglutarate-dependent dioxygenase AOP1.2-like [Capsicum annuum]